MAYRLTHLAVQGFKSLLDCSVDLTSINVLIGPNGAGKSNVLQLLQLAGKMMAGELGSIALHGGANAYLSFGSKRTTQLRLQFTCSVSADKSDPTFGSTRENGTVGSVDDRLVYSCTLQASDDNHLVFAEESVEGPGRECIDLGKWHDESTLSKMASWPDSGLPDALVTDPGKACQHRKILEQVRDCLASVRAFHFNDTSSAARLNQAQSISDNHGFRSDGANLGPILYRLKQHSPIEYSRICHCIRYIAPFFEDFVLQPDRFQPDTLKLAWKEKASDIPFGSHLLSDGLLRFICLVTALLLPDEMQPNLLLLDEPELGQHPIAMRFLAAMLKSAACSRQIVLSTQSVTFLDEFAVEDVIVADRRAGTATRLHRPDPEDLQTWLEEYSLGDLWLTNLIGGRL